MKKTYTLHIEGKNRDRLLDASKHDIRKYVKRERAKPLPEGVDFWDFDCKVGATETAAAPVHFAEIMGAVDALVKDGADQFYVEITSKSGHRAARPIDATVSENAPQALYTSQRAHLASVNSQQTEHPDRIFVRNSR